MRDMQRICTHLLSPKTKEWNVFADSFAQCDVRIVTIDPLLATSDTGLAYSLFRIKRFRTSDVCIILTFTDAGSRLRAFVQREEDGPIDVIATDETHDVLAFGNALSSAWVQKFQARICSHDASSRVRFVAVLVENALRDEFQQKDQTQVHRHGMHAKLMDYLAPACELWPNAVRPALCVFESRAAQVANEQNACLALYAGTDSHIVGCFSVYQSHTGSMFGQYLDADNVVGNFVNQCTSDPPHVLCTEFIKNVKQTKHPTVLICV